MNRKTTPIHICMTLVLASLPTLATIGVASDAHACDICARPAKLRGNLRVGSEVVKYIRVFAQTRTGNHVSEQTVNDNSTFSLLVDTAEPGADPLEFAMDFYSVRVATTGDEVWANYEIDSRQYKVANFGDEVTMDADFDTKPANIQVRVNGGRITYLEIKAFSRSGDSNAGNYRSERRWKPEEGDGASSVDYTFGVLGLGETIAFEGRAKITLDDGTKVEMFLDKIDFAGDDSQYTAIWELDPGQLGFLKGAINYTGLSSPLKSNRLSVRKNGSWVSIDQTNTDDRYSGGPLAPDNYWIDLVSTLTNGQRTTVSLPSDVKPGDNIFDVDIDFAKITKPVKVSGVDATMYETYINAGVSNGASNSRRVSATITESRDISASVGDFIINAEPSLDVPSGEGSLDILQFKLRSKPSFEGEETSYTKFEYRSWAEDSIFNLAPGEVKTLPVQEFDLAKATFTLDVIEKPGQEPVVLSQPELRGSRNDEPVNGRVTSYTSITATNNAEGTQPFISIFAPVNKVFSLTAEATVEGSRLKLGTRKMKISPSIPTEAGEDVLIALNESQVGVETQIQLILEEIIESGATNINVLPFGPQAPAGYDIYVVGEEPDQTPVYIDISTTAIPAPDSDVEICVSYDDAILADNGLMASQLKLGMFVRDAASDDDCGDFGNLVAPGWCNIRVPGSGLEAQDPEGFICGKAGADQLALAAVLVPNNVEPPNPVVVNCLEGDEMEEVNGVQVPVPPRVALANQYTTGLSVGSFVASLAWSTTDKDFSSFEPFSRRVLDAIRIAYAPTLASDTITDFSVCRVRGILQGIQDELGRISVGVIDTCEDVGASTGQVNGVTYCVIFGAAGSETDSGNVLPNATATTCKEGYENECRLQMIEYAQQNCAEYTTGPFAEPFQQAIEKMCIYEDL